MRKLLSIIILFIGIGQAIAQQPIIANIDPVSAYPSSRLAISGSGFGTDPSNLVVWFGTVEGSVTAVADNLIQVSVPAQAASDNITVVNLASGLAAQSDEKFYPVYSGSSFDPGKIEMPSIIADANEVYDPCTCDLDVDGRPDVVVTKFANATDLRLLHNQSTPGNISFVQSSIPIGQPTVNIRCGDLNGDGKPDLFMSRGGSSKFNIFVLQNTSTAGNISFNPAQSLGIIGDTEIQFRKVFHKDLNSDGRPELIATNSNSGEVIIFENTSAGTISFNNHRRVTIAGASLTAGLEVQDLDADSKPDIIVSQSNGNDVFVLRNTGSLSFQLAQVLNITQTSLLDLTTGDFNGNGNLDIAVVDNLGNRVFVFLNNSSAGTMSFAAPQSFAVNRGPWGITTGDADGDGLLDIITSSISTNTITVLNNESAGGVLDFVKKDVNINKQSRNIAVADLDGDAKPDFAVTAFDGSNNFDIRLIRNTNCYQPEILNEEPLAICPGQDITLSVPPSPAVTFSWTKDGAPIGTNSNTLNITAPGTYEITAASESGACSTVASIVVNDGSGTVPGAPVAGDSGPACIGGALTLTVNEVAGATYKWTGPNNFTSTEAQPVISDVTHDVAGIYTVTIKSGDCLSSESETTVEVVTMPEFNTIAAGARAVCSGSSVALSTESRPGYAYQWLKDGAELTGETTNSYSALTSGVYNVRIDDNNSNCEAYTPELEVNVYSPPVADFTIPAGGCVGAEIMIDNTSEVDASAPVVYNWSFGNTETSNDQSPVYAYSAAGDYTVQLEASYTGVAGCTDVQSSGISIKDPVVPVIESTGTSLCPGDELTLSITGDFDNILWTTSETTSSIIVRQPGTYSVTADDVNGCNAYAEITIDSKPVPSLTAHVIPDPADTIISVGNEVQLEATGADSYSWSPGISLNDSTIANPIARPEQTTTYVVTGTSSEGCPATAEITITVNKGGEIEITPMKAFSPNSTLHPYWEIQNVENYQDCTLSIYNENGSLVFRQKGYANDWNATYNGNNLPEGVYYYVFVGEGFKPKTGSVLVVR